METTHIFHVTGMHCKSCALKIESDLQELYYISNAKVDFKNSKVEVTGDFGDKVLEDIATELSNITLKHGYSLSVGKEEKTKNWHEFKIAIPIVFIFITLFILLQRSGLTNLINSSDVSYGTAFLIGIIASLSTCIAVVGGVILSMSATFAKSGDIFKPQVIFHISRLVSFFLLGGVIGALGTVFTLSTTVTVMLSLFVGIVMMILGINLLDIFPIFKNLQPSIPSFFLKHTTEVSKFNHIFTPVIIGIATFFLPCGFTQSMQIYTLSTGSFLNGAFTMLFFALGTLPVLGLISFSSFSVQNSSKSGVFFKTAGLIVILFALINILNSFVILGAIPPLFNF